MGFLEILGATADVFGITAPFISMLKNESAEYKSFCATIHNVIKTVCKEYTNFLDASADHRNIFFSEDYEAILCDAVESAVRCDTVFTEQMVLPNEKEFPKSEKERLFHMILDRLKLHSLEYLIRYHFSRTDEAHENQQRQLLKIYEEIMTINKKRSDEYNLTASDILEIKSSKSDIISSIENEHNGLKEYVEELFKDLEKKALSSTGIVPDSREEAQLLFSLYQKREFYYEDYDSYIKKLDIIFKEIDEDIFTLSELCTLLHTVSQLYNPHKDLFKFRDSNVLMRKGTTYQGASPQIGFQRMREYCIQLLAIKVDKSDNLSVSDLNSIIDMFPSDDCIFFQEELLIPSIATIVAKVIELNREYLQYAIEYVNEPYSPVIRDGKQQVNRESAYMLEGIFTTLYFIQQHDEYSRDEVCILKHYRNEAKNESLKYFIELILAIVEKRDPEYSGISFDNTYRVVNNHGKIYVVPIYPDS